MRPSINDYGSSQTSPPNLNHLHKITKTEENLWTFQWDQRNIKISQRNVKKQSAAKLGQNFRRTTHSVCAQSSQKIKMWAFVIRAGTALVHALSRKSTECIFRFPVTRIRQTSAPSPNRAWPTRESRWASDGPRNVTAVVWFYWHTSIDARVVPSRMRTRRPLYVSPNSLRRRSQ